MVAVSSKIMVASQRVRAGTVLVSVLLFSAIRTKAEENSRAAPQLALQVFKTNCMNCHESDGKGESSRKIMPKIPDFSDPKWHESRPDNELSRSILYGKGEMKPMGPKLGGVAPEQLVAIVRKFQDGEIPELSQENSEPTESKAQTVVGTKRGGRSVRTPAPHVPGASAASIATFQRMCQSCHGPDGSGILRDTFAALPDFRDPTWHVKRSDEALISSLLNGKNATMPSFRGQLGRTQVKELVSLVRAFNPKATSATLAKDSQTPPQEKEFDEKFKALSARLMKYEDEVRILQKSDR